MNSNFFLYSVCAYVGGGGEADCLFILCSQHHYQCKNLHNLKSDISIVAVKADGDKNV